jgi:hypothetical protein
MLTILLINVEASLEALLRRELPPSYLVVTEDEIKIEIKEDAIILFVDGGEIPLSRLYMIMEYKREACVVVISNDPSEEEESLAIRAGAQDYLYILEGELSTSISKAIKKAYERVQFLRKYSMSFLMGKSLHEDPYDRRLEAFAALVRLASIKQNLLLKTKVGGNIEK